ncbi:uncharacterized protein PGRI_001010 [Penicillium griseofulvum]|uniref:Uncharacterized protein n=1 Tax=Penicillium patulum TaxID=5078 RepID=A0A135LVW6_PENPA|nr:uncharacterized protein PGRI_001010 [Penicillium griseofulvum]KXG53051.1 hypothetical protein PGRI_001010 [Penicillium griseofulvum]
MSAPTSGHVLDASAHTSQSQSDHSKTVMSAPTPDHILDTSTHTGQSQSNPSKTVMSAPSQSQSDHSKTVMSAPTPDHILDTSTHTGQSQSNPSKTVMSAPSQSQSDHSKTVMSEPTPDHALDTSTHTGQSQSNPSKTVMSGPPDHVLDTSTHTGQSQSDHSEILISTSTPGHVLDSSAPDLQQSDATITILYLYRRHRRLREGVKHLFAPSDTSPAEYFIVNRIPHGHFYSWKPIFYRGDNPKYTPTATVIGRATRKGFWRSFCLEVGDGVPEILENEARAKAKRRAAMMAIIRKMIWWKPNPPTEPLEDEQEVLGKVAVVKVSKGFFTRNFDWELDGVQYRWSGTRMFSSGLMKGVKGCTHDLKLVRKSDDAVIAIFEKGRWASYTKSVRSEGPNKSKQLIGKLKVSCQSAASNVIVPPNHRASEDICIGADAGNLTADVIALTCWIAVEAEHRIRYKYLKMAVKWGVF